jgi:hypothetical protein
MPTAKCRGAVAPALQAAPPLLASVDSQIVRRQRVSPATTAWNIRSPDFATIAIAEVDDRRTISTDHAPLPLEETTLPVALNHSVDSAACNGSSACDRVKVATR